MGKEGQVIFDFQTFTKIEIMKSMIKLVDVLKNNGNQDVYATTRKKEALKMDCLL